MGEKGEGIKKYRLVLLSTNLRQNSHGDIKYSRGKIVSNSLMTTHGARWVLKILEHFVEYMTV